jgi:hypothetical protein
MSQRLDAAACETVFDHFDRPSSVTPLLAGSSEPGATE